MLLLPPGAAAPRVLDPIAARLAAVLPAEQGPDTDVLVLAERVRDMAAEAVSAGGDPDVALEAAVLTVLDGIALDAAA